MKLSPSRRACCGSLIFDRLAVQANYAAVRFDQPGEAADERGLARTIGAHKPMHLAGNDVQIDALQSLNATKMFVEFLYLQERSVCCHVRHLPIRAVLMPRRHQNRLV